MVKFPNGPAPQVRWKEKLQAAHPGYAPEPCSTQKDERHWARRHQGRGLRVTQQPPISYTQYKYPKWLSEPDTVKVKLPQGDQYVCGLMHDASNAETYLKWFQTYLRVLDKK